MRRVPLGLPADEVLKRVGRGKRSKKLGIDTDERSLMNGKPGYIVEWEYSWGVLVFKRREVDGVHCYRVVEKRAK